MVNLAPCVWIPGRAEDAAAFYLGTFRAAGQTAEIRRRMRLGADGALLAVTVELAGQEVMLFNPPGEATHSHAISLFLTCRDQREVDALWNGLLDGGAPVQCGWLRDRYGVSWQVVPAAIGERIDTADAAQADRVVQAIQGMVKLDQSALERAFTGPG